MLFSYKLLLLYLISLFAIVILPQTWLGYLIIMGMVLLSYAYLKTNIALLFIYYPLRPLLIELNSGLTFLGDVVIISSVLVILYVERHAIKSLFKKLSFFMYFFLFVLVGSVSALLVSNQAIIPILMEVRALVIMTLLVLVFTSSIWLKRDLVNILNISLIVAFIISLYGLFEKLFGKDVVFPAAWASWDLSSQNASRVYGALANPNVLAMYLLTVFALSFLPVIRLSVNQFFLRLVQFTILSTVLLTVSRGAILAFLIALMVYIIMTRSWKLIIKIGLIGVLSFLFVTYPVEYGAEYIQNDATTEQKKNKKRKKSESYSLFERLEMMFSDSTIESSKNWGRLYIVDKGIEVFQDHPVIGTGFATFGDSATQRFPSPIYDQYDIDEDIYSDNQYIHILVSTGIVGALLLIIFLVRLCVVAWKDFYQEERRLFGLFLIVLMISCLYYNTLEDKTFMLWFYTLLGWLINPSRQED
ncbi:O-antigen ligase family protein [Aquisalibacillus elongatus]|uniref:O-antigen ligase n=1 Tax=Aquisalibacillus elongatus TaxID=485577 RepID=A0A3N5B9W2_9BACI|nr:O-antigen ligase family protein [Aquisalibacillus elongatus]RPF54193.1 O-antigen ligase [Aquisalibacillus elongatus]